MRLHINLPLGKDQPGWWDDHWQSQDGPTYEQQLKDGFLPVYQGGPSSVFSRFQMIFC